ncbi:hypothetical protein [Pandoraea communis]|uniref:hypothetical protein n=1 Tax=Pandoraea communis TaxID=2508297 RepID=UPI001FED18C9|nr:hypothetical protein [Pandoraea communis]
MASNRRDFPDAIASEYGLEIVDPDRFIINQWDLDSVGAMTALSKCVPDVESHNPTWKISPKLWSAAVFRQPLNAFVTPRTCSDPA